MYNISSPVKVTLKKPRTKHIVHFVGITIPITRKISVLFYHV